MPDLTAVGGWAVAVLLGIITLRDQGFVRSIDELAEAVK